MADRIVTHDRTPRFDYWLGKQNASLWQCVVLWLNIEPDTIGIDDDWVDKDHILNESQKLHDLLRVAEEAVASGELPWERNGPECLFPPMYRIGGIRDFAKWARRSGWEVSELMAAKLAQECPDIRAPSEERAAEDARDIAEAANIFKAMDELKWNEVSMRFDEPDAVRIKARDKSGTFGYEAMGFKNKQTKTAMPNKVWNTLQTIAITTTTDKTLSDVLPPATNFKSRVSELRNVLKAFFGIKDNPILYAERVYKPAFILVIEPHVIAKIRENPSTNNRTSEGEVVDENPAEDYNNNIRDDEDEEENYAEEMSQPPTW